MLGVRRSGTTLLRVMLDRHSQLAIPDESYVIPQLAARHPHALSPERFTDDLHRLTRLRELGIEPEAVGRRLRPGMDTGHALSAIFETYAATNGKPRWGDKTPLYMQYLPLLERLFPNALFVHLIRDGRDAALSFLAVPAGLMTESFGHPGDASGFACLWRTEVLAARALGARVGADRYLEIRYEHLVSDTEGALRRVCRFAALEYEDGMTGYVGAVDVRDKPHQQRLLHPPTPGVRDWRVEMAPSDVRSFEAVAGDLLSALGYESSLRRPTLGGRLRVASFRARSSAWRAVAAGMQRSPLWTRRHPVVS